MSINDNIPAEWKSLARKAAAFDEMREALKLYLAAPAGKRGALRRAEAHKAAHAILAKTEGDA